MDYRTLGNFITDYSANVSAGGVFVQTSLPLNVGDRVRLRISFPTGDAPFALDGIVKWVSPLHLRDQTPPGMGIEFTNFDDETKKKLEELVAAHGEHADQD